MKYLFFTIIIGVIGLCNMRVTLGQETIIFHESFETDSSWSKWTHEAIVPQAKWKKMAGTTEGFPEEAKDGFYNATFEYLSTNNETAKLISPSLDFVTIQRYKLELRFWHTQDDFSGNTDNLSVYYKVNIDSFWNLLRTYLDPQETWVERVILLPDSIYSDDFYIAFEGLTNRGHGICVDSVVIVETGIIKRYVDTIIASNVTTDFLRSEDPT